MLANTIMILFSQLPWIIRCDLFMMLSDSEGILNPLEWCLRHALIIRLLSPLFFSFFSFFLLDLFFFFSKSLANNVLFKMSDTT